MCTFTDVSHAVQRSCSYVCSQRTQKNVSVVLIVAAFVALIAALLFSLFNFNLQRGTQLITALSLLAAASVFGMIAGLLRGGFGG